MSDEIGRLGGHIGRENIYCMPCDEDSRHSGGFNPRFGIKLCANEMRNRGHVEDTLAHGTTSFLFSFLPTPNHEAHSDFARQR